MVKRDIEVENGKGETIRLPAEIHGPIAIHKTVGTLKRHQWTLTHLPSGKVLGSNLSPKKIARRCTKKLRKEFEEMLWLDGPELLKARDELEENRRELFDLLRTGKIEDPKVNPPPVCELPLGDKVELVDLQEIARAGDPQWRSVLDTGLRDPGFTVIDGIPRTFDRRVVVAACHWLLKSGIAFARVELEPPSPPSKPVEEMTYAQKRAYEGQRAFLRIDAGDAVCRIPCVRID